MSKALDFLLAARPEAMSAYFGFLKHNGSRLDPKTRALISVITKVAVQTDKGLVQYTRKALEVGASADEVLDALMMAFPALGLSRIVWAIDILIEHEVEGFASAIAMAPANELAAESASEVAKPRLNVCAMTALPPDQAVKYISEGHPLLLYRTADEVRAYKAYCSHQGMELMPSGIRGRRVTCRQHNWQFELPDGSCAHGPKWSLTELSVTLEHGRVIVEWQD